MNERMREMAEQATDKWVGGEFFDRKKFAELIIRECAHVGFFAAFPGKGIDVEIAIKQHFGIE